MQSTGDRKLIAPSSIVFPDESLDNWSKRGKRREVAKKFACQFFEIAALPSGFFSPSECLLLILPNNFFIRFGRISERNLDARMRTDAI